MTTAWRFDPIPASGAIQGGAAETFVFKPRLESFVREVLQNSHDQRVGFDPVVVEFVFHEWSPGTDGRDGLEQAIGFTQLREHLRAATAADSTMGLRIEQALEDLQSEPLVCLEVNDRGTAGLIGGEFERGANFAALCRNVLDTPPGKKPGRGGSYGLGKAVLWLYSSLSTIIFSSSLSEPIDGQRRRLIGRSVLPYHEVNGRKLSGLGWLGEHDHDEEGRERSVSAWGPAADDLGKQIGLERQDEHPGTSILVLGFREPYLDANRDPTQIAEEVLAHSSRWFWPAMTASPPSLTVSARVLRNGVEVFSQRAEPGATELPFITAATASDAQSTAPTAGAVAEQSIDFLVPAMKKPAAGDPEGEVAAKFRVRVTRTEESGHELANHVALIRGAGMVVDYKEWASSPSDGRPFFGVLSAGLAHGSDVSDLAAESFLRAAEPPAHDAWEATDAVRTRYQKGGASRLGALRGNVKDAVARMCEEGIPKSQQGPSLLADLLPLGSKAGKVKPPGPSFNVTFDETTFEGGVWFVAGTVTRHRGEGSWHTTVKLALDAESGKPDPIPLDGCSAHAGSTTLDVSERQESSVVHVDGPHDEITFVAHGSAARLGDAARTRLLVDVRPQLGDGR